MKWYLIGETLMPLERAPGEDEAAVVLLDSDELAHTSELPGLVRVLHHTPLARDARVCKAEVRSDCLSGTLALPRSGKDGTRLGCGYLVTKMRVVLVDDSIVRGTTSARIIKLLRDAGAAEVHFMVSAPPFKYPCYFGTDIPDQKLLVATGRTLEQINEVIGADTLGYLSNEHVVQLAKNAKCGFCTACFTGEYAVRPEEVLSTDIHERHLNDRPKNEKKLGE